MSNTQFELNNDEIAMLNKSKKLYRYQIIMVTPVILIVLFGLLNGIFSLFL